MNKSSRRWWNLGLLSHRTLTMRRQWRRVDIHGVASIDPMISDSTQRMDNKLGRVS